VGPFRGAFCVILEISRWHRLAGSFNFLELLCGSSSRHSATPNLASATFALDA
jgi:hypothetical protein